jgi:hypothetical protein
MTKEGEMRKLILAATAAATLVGPAVATASATTTPAKGFRVHACVRHTKHGLKSRVAQKCRKGEKGVWLRLPGSQAMKTQISSLGTQAILGTNGTNGTDGKDGINGTNGTNGATGPAGPIGATGFAGAFYSVEQYPNGATGNSIATVACDPNDADNSQNYVAISGGVQNADNSTDMYSQNNQLPVSASFPGRMDWSTNTPKPNRLDGWVIQFAGAAGQQDKSLSVWALCVPKGNVGSVVTNSLS